MNKYISLMHNLPLVNIRLTLKSRTIRIPTRSEVKKSGKVNQLQSHASTPPSSFAPLQIQSKETQKLEEKLCEKIHTHDSVKEVVDSHLHQKQIEEPQNSVKEIRSQARTRIRKTSLHVRGKKCSCGECEECMKDFTHFLTMFSNSQNHLPQISAKSWCIWRKGKNERYIYYYGKKIHKTREIASLTKMITAITAVDFLHKHNYDPKQVTFPVRKSATLIGGTTANLQIEEVYTVEELLYGLLLPSGNDAGYVIGEAIGLLAHLHYRNINPHPHNSNWYDTFLPSTPQKTPSYTFLTLLNERCKKMGLLDTHLYNPHGNDAFDHFKNVSTCNQMAKVSAQLMMKYQQIKVVSKARKYRVERYDKIWQNTNKLLQDGFEGIKTGVTETAGPCLSAAYKDVIVVVLNSKTMHERWTQVKKLIKWLYKKHP